MKEETIIETKAPEEETHRPINKGKESPQQKTANNQSTPDDKNHCCKKQSNASEQNKKGIGIAGIAGASGLASGVLIPKQVFPNNVDDVNDVDEMVEATDDSKEYSEVDAPAPKGHITGHDMDVATSVDDSMTFNQAFAAAREEVGAGGLFVWHGHTYGTYYANEWNSMTPEERDQYWADVHHTTSHINDEINEEPDEPTTDEEPTDDPIDPSDDEEPVDPDDISDGDVPSDPPEGWDGKDDPIDSSDDEEPVDPDDISDGDAPSDPIGEWDGSDEPIDEVSLPIDDEGVLHLNEDQVNGTFDTDWDGITDGMEVDVNENDIPDLVIDHDGDGTFDTLEIDVDTDGSVAETHAISDLEIEFHDEMDFHDVAYHDHNTMADDEIEAIEDNPDIDILADNTIDDEIPFDNDMDMSDFA